jgi:glycosyltransferase involved in cell wall biosynthesis
MLNVGGAEKVLVTLANILNSQGHDVTVLTTVRKGTLAQLLHPNITQINLARKSKWNPFDMRRMINILRRFDVVHVHSSYNLRYVYLAARIFGLRKRLFFHEHFGDIEINTASTWHQRLIYPETIMICVSRKLRQWAIEKVGMKEMNVFLLPNIAIKNEEVIKTGKKENAAIQLLMVANIRPTKNIEFAIELVAELIKLQPYHLTIIGQKTDNNYYKKILQAIDQKNLSRSITFKSDITDIQPILKDFDLAIHTAKSESGPLVLIEYMAQGLLFLTFKTGEVVDQIKYDMPQLIMDNLYLFEWIERIEKIIIQPQDKLQLQLFSLYEKYFSAEIYYQKCISIYEAGLALN